MNTVIRYDHGYIVGRTTDGIDFTPVGPRFPMPRPAIEYANALDQPYVLPLRSPAMGSAPVPRAPLAGPGRPSPSQVSVTDTSRQSRRRVMTAG